MRRERVRDAAAVALVVALAFLTAEAGAQTYKIQHVFDPGNTCPADAITQVGSKLYGIRTDDDGLGYGAVFSVDLTDNSETVLHWFPMFPEDGKTLSSSPIQVGNSLYGMTYAGGSSGKGTIFSIGITNNSETVLHSFAGGAGDGWGPMGSLVQSGSLLYGFTMRGGSSDSGTILSFDTASNAVTVLYSFAGGLSAGPIDTPLLSGRTLYGMTWNGGAHNLGAIFSFGTTNSAFNVLHSFSSAGDGSHPTGSLITSGRMVYGMTNEGGTHNAGTIFALDLADNAETILHSFSGGIDDGSESYQGGVYPANSLILSGNTL